MARRIVVVGTGTEVGKTHVTSCVLRAARAEGLRAGAYKPISTGFATRCADAERHAVASGRPYVAPTFGYLRPVSPHLAAREEDRAIDLRVVRARADELAAGLDLQIVEGAGGLFSPLGPRYTNVHLVRALQPAALVLVALDLLGVLHDLGAAIRGARALDLRDALVVLSTPVRPDVATGTNAGELTALGLADAPVVFPRAADDAPASVAAGALVLRRA